MKAPDLKSVLVAAAIGAVVLLIEEQIIDTNNPGRGNIAFYALLGAVVGAMVQVGVRLAGVS